ncbi:Transcription factor E3 [Wickerhamomyces ciferrii]|uniref:Transcription factor E3 n=1 Tax=Wickerhamomyces ciferrii (strain ATCC 14091 / BCRC 22168 / CBS 111 / JCM 3599 / NBRC 0793 / NRRL Y-1031 F-60-10) TaxID=1206466 RepID=K0KIA6_WICCF|nr:Transcription factor E3 [Wickerhamomyces ciferrii]CCH44945.1 Transcription factor E3 [Wickerhamomyces ciferrii]
MDFMDYKGKKEDEQLSLPDNLSEFNIPDSTIDENELLDFSSIDDAFAKNRGTQGAQGTQGTNQGSHNLSTSQSKRLPSSLNNNSYLSQSLSSSIPIKQSLAKALPTLSESYNSNADTSNKIHKSTSRRKSSIKKEIQDDDDDTVERKRRDNMNDKIQELLTLIPEDFFNDNKDKSSGTKDGKPNKGQILTKGLEYIQNLQNKIDENNRKEVELILKLKNLSLQKGQFVTDINLNNTSAEIILGEIGVGPLAGVVNTNNNNSNSNTVDATTTISSNSQKSPNNNFEYGGYDQYGN